MCMYPWLKIKCCLSKSNKWKFITLQKAVTGPDLYNCRVVGLKLECICILRLIFPGFCFVFIFVLYCFVFVCLLLWRPTISSSFSALYNDLIFIFLGKSFSSSILPVKFQFPGKFVPPIPVSSHKINSVNPLFENLWSSYKPIENSLSTLDPQDTLWQRGLKNSQNWYLLYSKVLVQQPTHELLKPFYLVTNCVHITFLQTNLRSYKVQS